MQIEGNVNHCTSKNIFQISQSPSLHSPIKLLIIKGHVVPKVVPTKDLLSHLLGTFTNDYCFIPILLYTWQSMQRQLSVSEQVRPRISTASLYNSVLDFRCLGGEVGALTVPVPDGLLPLFSLEEDSRDKDEVDVDPLGRSSLVSSARPAGEANSCSMSMSCGRL